MHPIYCRKEIACEAEFRAYIWMTGPNEPLFEGGGGWKGLS